MCLLLGVKLPPVTTPFLCTGKPPTTPTYFRLLCSEFHLDTWLYHAFYPVFDAYTCNVVWIQKGITDPNKPTHVVGHTPTLPGAVIMYHKFERIKTHRNMCSGDEGGNVDF